MTRGAILLLLLIAPWPARAGDGVWQSAGPAAVPEVDGWEVVVAPTSPSTVYVGWERIPDEDIGILKSTDGGQTWRPADNGYSDSRISVLAVDPLTPTTLFAGGRERLLRSTDSGDSWRTLKELPGIADIAIDPGNPRKVYAASSSGLFKSEDGGETWNMLDLGSSSDPRAIAIDPVTPTTLYCGTFGARRLLKSTDEGATWMSVSTDAVWEIAIDPSTPRRIYALSFGGVVRSTDGGITWAVVMSRHPNDRARGLVVNRHNPAEVFAGFPGNPGGVVMKTGDFGDTWRASPTFGTGVNSLAVDPTRPGTIFAASIQAVFKSSDAAASWEPALAWAPASMWAVAVDPVNPSTVYASSHRSRSVYKSADAGASWVPADAGIGSRRIYSLAIDPTTPTTLYAGGTNDVYKSTDAAATWVLTGPVPPGAGGISFLRVDPVTPSIIYAATFRNGIMKSTDSGAAWTTCNDGFPDLNTWGFAIDPQTTTTLYATSLAGVFKSVDGGTRWTPTTLTQPVVALALDPRTPGTLYAWQWLDLYRSTDAGLTWVSLGAGPSSFAPSAVVVDPRQSSTLYTAFHDFGVYRSTDSGITWSDFNTGLTAGMTRGLAVDPVEGTLYAATRGGGVWHRRPTKGEFNTLTPCRAVDTRTADGPGLGADAQRVFKLVGRCGIPAEARAVSLNVTVTDADASGHIRLFPGNTSTVASSSLNFTAGQTRANNAIALLGAAGDLAVYTAQAAGSIHLIVDVNGYFR